MRIRFKTTDRPKAVAKTLQRSMEFLGDAVTLCTAQSLVAAIYGYRDWRELNVEAGKFDQSPADEQLSDGDGEERKRFQVAKLVSKGCLPHHAAYLVTTIRPTASKTAHFADIADVHAYFDDLKDLIGAVGYRLYAQGEMHGAVEYRIGGEWQRDPIRRTHIADWILTVDPTLGGISAVSVM